jgi:ribosomal protein S18 acetylase RimI-like enzyme
MDGVMLRDGRQADGVRCQEIAVMAWTPIYAARRRDLGDALFTRLHPTWQTTKAAQIAGHFDRHGDWVVVATAPGASRRPRDGDQSAPNEAAATDEPDGPGETVVGFATYRLDPATGVGTILNNAVDPAWQGRGIATALYEEVLARFRAAGMRVAAVTTGLDAPHAPARAAYRRVGFGPAVESVTLYQEL